MADCVSKDSKFFVATMASGDIVDVARMLRECDVWIGQDNIENCLRVKLCRDPQLTVVAWCDSKIVGFIMASFDGMIAPITHFYVLKEYRAKRIADCLADEMERRLLKMDATEVVSLVKSENLRLKDIFCKRYGFKEGIDVTMLTKKLGAR